MDLKRWTGWRSIDRALLGETGFDFERNILRMRKFGREVRRHVKGTHSEEACQRDASCFLRGSNGQAKCS